jgi:hypothetical protein
MDDDEQNAMKAALCFDELRELAGDSSVPRQQLIEPRSGNVSTAAKIRGWTQTLEALERGELSNTEVESILRDELPRALEECFAGTYAATGAELKEWSRLQRVTGKVIKALERRVKALGLRRRTPRWP